MARLVQLERGRSDRMGDFSWHRLTLRCKRDWWREATKVEADLAKDNDPGAKARYKYFVDMVGTGWREYMKWRHHDGWKGRYLKENTRALRRTAAGLTVADGVIFPIISAMPHPDGSTRDLFGRRAREPRQSLGGRACLA